MASILGVSHAAISKWENGHSKPSKRMALRLADVMSELHKSRLRAELVYTAPQQQMKVLTRGRNLQLFAVSAGFAKAWPETAAFAEKELKPFLINEALQYVENSGFLEEAIHGELLALSCVSNRLLMVGGDVSESARLRWHSIVRQIDGELIHEVVFEPCHENSPVGFDYVLRRSDVGANYE